MRSGDKVDIFGAIHAVQSQLMLPVHVAGKTALDLHGEVHFVRQQDLNRVLLLAEPKTKLPPWLKQNNLSKKIAFSTMGLFSNPVESSLTSIFVEKLSIQASSRERAILEHLAFVPTWGSLTEAKHLLEGLTTLRPKLIQNLLETCTSVKAKRLFCYLSEKVNPPWFKKLDLTKVNLGTGKRQIVKGGRWVAKYQITVDDEDEIIQETSA